MPDNEQSVFSDFGRALVLTHPLSFMKDLLCSSTPKMWFKVCYIWANFLHQRTMHGPPVLVMVYVTYICLAIVWPANPKGVISNVSQRGIFMHLSPKTVKCFGPQIWFTLTEKALFAHGSLPLIRIPKCVMVRCVQSILMVLVFSPKLPVLLSSLSLLLKCKSFEPDILQKSKKNKINFSFLDYLRQALSKKKTKQNNKNLAPHFGAFSHCPVCYCVMNHPLPRLGEETMFSSSLWQEGIVKVK